MKSNFKTINNSINGEYENKQMQYIDSKLDEADKFAKSTKERLTHDEVFKNIKSNLSKDDESSF